MLGFKTTIRNFGITIDPVLLDECARIWRMSGYQGLPPSPYEVMVMDVARLQVVTYVEILQWEADTEKRRKMGGV